jgi:tRNA U34 5-methylaminomethyl-2-thiouridine-forming methyltransferase MnmC
MIMKTDSHLVLTADGSHTVVNETLGIHYHSIFGSVQESERVFIELGLHEAFTRFSGRLSVFEMGLGTGLNALMTARDALRLHRHVNYIAVEAFPLAVDQALDLNYDGFLNTFWVPDIHLTPWERPAQINDYLTLTKHQIMLEEFQAEEQFHLVYFDAFSPEAQPEMWTTEVFAKIGSMMVPGGIMATYCSKSSVQRNLREAGFIVEKHRGPARKREVVRAIWPATQEASY